jgi:hypothetical protein
MSMMAKPFKLSTILIPSSPWWWRLTAADRRWVTVAAASLGFLLALTAMATWWQLHAYRHVTQQLADARRAQALMAQEADANAKARAQIKPPWWTLVPASPTGERSAAEQLSADALALGPKLGVQVQRLTFGSPAHAEGARYRSTAVQAEVRGSYADIKRWIAELLARRPRSLALKTLDLRRALDAGAVSASTQSGSIDASIEWRLFERASEH